MNKKRMTRLLPWLWFFACVGMLGLFMAQRMDCLLNSDMSSELVLAKLLSNEHAILSQNWYYATELHVFYSQLIYAPLFQLFSDWHTVRLVGGAILFALLLGSYGYLCRRLHVGKWFLWSAPVLLTPFSALYFHYAVYGTHYTFFLATAFIVMGMIIHWRQSDRRGVRAALAAGIGVLSLLSGLNGPRYLMVFYAPLCAAGVWQLAVHRRALLTDKAALRGNTWAAYTGIAVFAAVCAMAGYLINTRILAAHYAFLQYNEVSFNAFDIGEVSALVNGWLQAFGFAQADELISVHALQNLFALCWMVLTGVSVRGMLKETDRYDEQEQFFARFFLASVVVFMATYLITDAPFNQRYYIPVTIFALPVIVVWFNRVAWKPAWKRATVVLLIASVAFNSALAYHRLYQTDDTAELRQIAAQLQKEEYHEGYASFWNANVLTELADGTIDVRSWGSDTTNVLPDMGALDNVNAWLQRKSHEDTVPRGRVFILFNNRERGAFSILALLEGQTVLYESDEYVVYGFSSYNALYTCVEGSQSPRP